MRGEETVGIEKAHVSVEESEGIEHHTPSRQSYLSNSNSDTDSDSDSEISDEDFVGYEDTESL